MLFFSIVMTMLLLITAGIAIEKQANSEASALILLGTWGMIVVILNIGGF